MKPPLQRSNQKNAPEGNQRCTLKYVLEGHQKGVNWVDFHPKLPLLVSGADDKKVKLWMYDGVKAWEHDSYDAADHNISCVRFHPRKDVVISASEDKRMRFWNMDRSKNTLLQTFQGDGRFWMLDAHPEKDLFAAGGDHGWILFNTETCPIGNGNEYLSSTTQLFNGLSEEIYATFPKTLLEQLLQIVRSSTPQSAVASELFAALVLVAVNEHESTVNHNSTEIALATLKSFITDTFFCKCAFRILAVLARTGKNKDRSEQIRCTENILSAMRIHIHDPDVQAEGSLALLVFAMQSVNNKLDIAQRGGVQLLLAISNHVDVQVRIFSLLCSLLFNSSSATHIAIIEFVESLSRAMKTHVRDANLQLIGCVTLYLLAYCDSDVVDELGGVEAILAAMRVHFKNADVQAQGCLALWNLATQGFYDSRQNHIISLEAVELIVQTVMRNHIQDTQILINGCGFLWSLCVTDANKAKIASAEFVKTAISVMQVHMSNPELQISLCKILTQLDGKDLANFADVIINLVAIMTEQHRQNGLIQLLGVILLTKVVTSKSKNVTPVLTAKATEVAISAMKTDPQYIHLRGTGCAMLAVLTGGKYHPPVLPSTLVSDLAKLRHDQAFCDITLLCNGRRISAHKIMLARAKVFFDMFKSKPDLSEMTLDCRYEVAEKFLDHLYEQLLGNIQAPLASELAAVCDKYGMRKPQALRSDVRQNHAKPDKPATSSNDVFRWAKSLKESVKEVFDSDSKVAEAPFAKDMKQFVGSAFLSDISFEVEGQIIHAHKALLAARSSLFKTLIEKSANAKCVKVGNMKVSVIQRILTYIYTDETDLESADVNELVKTLLAAEKFQLPQMKSVLEMSLSNFPRDNFELMFEVSQRSQSFPLTTFCLVWLLSKWNSVHFDKMKNEKTKALQNQYEPYRTNNCTIS
eukprot:TRINITY_DN6289_c0_g2_i1.p1 TRINITY_DN6289_c0_g2~~TRINITY_DN6289_c0_g2_i1.p1  ORF type:complete len:922 (-),score=147.76 TRINITY_DN6289_c0_g2_i1:1009-3774(-)